jgi:hypothetical protein
MEKFVMDSFKMKLNFEIQDAVTKWKNEKDSSKITKIADERGEIYRQGILKGLELAGFMNGVERR